MLFLGETSIPRPLIPKISKQGDILKERLKQIREYTGLSQKEFSERIHIGASTLAMLETGDRKIKDLHVSLICTAFNIDEHWFRTGEGDMLGQQARDEKTAHFIGQMLKEEGDTFKKRLINLLCALDEDDWEALEKIARKIEKGIINPPLIP